MGIPGEVLTAVALRRAGYVREWRDLERAWRRHTYRRGRAVVEIVSGGHVVVSRAGVERYDRPVWSATCTPSMPADVVVSLAGEAV